jgi:L-ascorbate metabolism protein UlaG (beta-lactamase superfamily)
LGYDPVGAEHGVTAVRITHIGGPTTLIQADGWSLLTDPTFDDPGRRYAFGWGTKACAKSPNASKSTPPSCTWEACAFQLRDRSGTR